MIRFQVLVLALATTFGAGQITCRFGPGPLPGERSLNVPHRAQPPQSFWCGPASVSMWAAYRGQEWTQPTIFDWMVANYPGQAGEFGVAPEVMAAALGQFAGVNATREFYAIPAETRIAMADLSKNIYLGDPVLSIVNQGFHAVIVNGVTWQTIENVHPQADYVIVQDPQRSPRTLYTAGTWINDVGRGCWGGGCMQSVMRQGRRSFASMELEEFEYLGGVYSGPPPDGATGRWKVDGLGGCYWDGNDSGPDQCSAPGGGRWKIGDGDICYWDANDSGPDQCSPSFVADLGLGRRLLTIAGRILNRSGRKLGSQSSARFSTQPMAVAPISTMSEGLPTRRRATGTSARQRLSKVPRPFAKTRDSILTNFYAAVRQTRLDQMPGLEKLTDPGSGWMVRDVIAVSRADNGSNYHLLHVVNWAGTIVGAAAVDEEGHLMGYEDALTVSPPRPSSLTSAETAVRGRGRGNAVRSSRLVFAPGTLEGGGSIFAPLVLIVASDGDYYVNSSGEVFEETMPGQPARQGGDERILTGAGGSVRLFRRIE